MSNAGKPEESKDDALAALHGLGASDEQEGQEGQEEHEEAEALEGGKEVRDDGSANSSASGFVGMLAKQGEPEGGLSAVPPVKRASTRDEIRMAREIQPGEMPVAMPIAAPAARGAKRAAQVPGWYHIAVPVMFTLGSLLILIGLWAAGALIYMALKTPASPADVGYPWISWEMDPDTEAGAFSQGSKIMAMSMLICLPVAIATGAMAAMMQKRIRAADRAAGK